MKLGIFAISTAAALVLAGGALAESSGDLPVFVGKAGLQSLKEQRLKELDIDGDGKITRQEITASRVEEFNGVDADGDGALSIGELRAFIEKRDQRRLEVVLMVLDRDGDGRVTADEFAAAKSLGGSRQAGQQRHARQGGKRGGKRGGAGSHQRGFGLW